MMRLLFLGPAWLWLLLFVAIPAALLGVIAFATSTEGVPPYVLGTSLDNFATMVADDYYLNGFLQSLEVASVSAVACLLIGYPMALAIARTAVGRQPLLMLLVMLPFWTGFLLRIAAWIGLLRDDGWINAALLASGIVSQPVHMLFTQFAMYVGIVYAYLPFMVLPLHARLSRADPALEQAASDLGAAPWRVFATVTLPLSLPGVLAGLVLVFVPVTGEFVIPELLGGPASQTMGRLIWEEFFGNHDWPLASALALVLLAMLLLPATLLRLRRT